MSTAISVLFVLVMVTVPCLSSTSPYAQVLGRWWAGGGRRPIMSPANAVVTTTPYLTPQALRGDPQIICNGTSKPELVVGSVVQLVKSPKRVIENHILETSVGVVVDILDKHEFAIRSSDTPKDLLYVVKWNKTGHAGFYEYGGPNCVFEILVADTTSELWQRLENFKSRVIFVRRGPAWEDQAEVADDAKRNEIGAVQLVQRSKSKVTILWESRQDAKTYTLKNEEAIEIVEFVDEDD